MLKRDAELRTIGNDIKHARLSMDCQRHGVGAPACKPAMNQNLTDMLTYSLSSPFCGEPVLMVRGTTLPRTRRP